MYPGVFLVCFVLGGQPAAVAEPVYEFKLHKDNSIVAVTEKNRTVFVVTNPFGIGEGTINLKAGQWPENVALRFQYKNEKGRGFTNLEHIRITTDRVHTEGNVGLTGKFPFYFLDSKRQKPFEVLDDRRAAGVLKILVEPRDGALEVTFPAHLLTGSTQLDLYWIDAYRR